MGQLVDSDERWEFYSAINIEKPSKEELKYLKGIIISSSNQTVKNAKLKEKDEAIYKRFIKKTGPPSNNTQSEMGA